MNRSSIANGEVHHKATQAFGIRREPSIDSCSEAASEEAENFKPGEVLIGRVVDITEDYVTLSSIEQNKEYRVSTEGFKIQPELTEYYKIEGFLQKQDGTFLVESAKKLKNGCNELKILNNKTNVISTETTNNSVPSSFRAFLSQCRNGADEKEDQSILSNATDIDLDETLKAAEHQDEISMKEEQQAKINIENDDQKATAAVVLKIDKSNYAVMFSPAEKRFIECHLDRLEGPVKIGNWYLLPAEQENFDGPMIIPTKMAPIFNNDSPLKTRVSNSVVQLYIGESTIIDGLQINGFLCCESKKFPHKVIDSSCLLQNTKLQPPIRNAPKIRFGIWCSLRKHPIGNFYWKIVAISPKMRKKQPKIDVQTVAEEAYKNNECGKKLGPDFEKTHSMDDPDAPMEGFICSQSADHFIVYSPKGRFIAYLDKGSCPDDLLGTWITFKFCFRDERRTVTNFQVIKPVFVIIATNECILFRSKISVPRAMESTLPPICESLDVSLSDPHGLLRSVHCGKTLDATIGCQLENKGNQMSAEDIKWNILYVEDE